MQTKAPGWMAGLAAIVCFAGVAYAEDGHGTSVKMPALDVAPTALRVSVAATGFLKQTADINMDKAVDQVVYTDAAGQARAAVRDLDFDGRADLVEFFSPTGEVVERQYQMDFDPYVDVVRFYEGTVLVQKLVATGFDGSLSLEKYYDLQGNLSRTARDTNFDGKPDLWEYFSEGKLVNRTRDLDGDGEPDKIDALESK